MTYEPETPELKALYVKQLLSNVEIDKLTEAIQTVKSSTIKSILEKRRLKLMLLVNEIIKETLALLREQKPE